MDERNSGRRVALASWRPPPGVAEESGGDLMGEGYAISPFEAR